MKIFLLIPNIPGESTAAGYTGQIECQSFTHEAKVPPANVTTKPPPEIVQITKAWDKASPALASALVAQTVFPKVTVTFVQETPSFGAKHLTITYANVKVLGFEYTGVQGGAALVTEKVELIHTGVELEFSAPGTTARRVTDL